MITLDEYIARRQRLAKHLPANSVAIIPAAYEKLRNGDVTYRFRQNSDFYYLTGFNEPDAVLFVFSTPDVKSILFNRPNNPAEEQWTGARLGQEKASLILGVDAAQAIDNLDEQLPILLQNIDSIYVSIGQDKVFDDRILNAWMQVKKQVRKGVTAPQSFCDLYPVLSEMRLIKSEAEIGLMRRAAEITVSGHKRAMKACRFVQNEYELEAEILHEFAKLGSRNVAYESIVAGGERACTLHYTANNQSLKSGCLVLIDAGAEYENYAADVTRTFPINGRFNPNQRAIYNLVLKAQQAGIAKIKPGCIWNEIQMVIVEILTEGLLKLGILQGDLKQLIANEAYKPFYMHSSGHWLGLDVHDCGRYRLNQAWRKLEPGMVLTVEPGLYIPDNIAGVDACWWNIGVRIEDDILVTNTGYENLTAKLPVEIDALEALICE